MSQERTEYFSILTAKQPYEATEAIRIRLSQAKLINKDFYTFFKEITDLKKSYAQQLRKIIAENEDLNKILANQMLENQVLTPDEMTNFKFDSLGELNGLWNTVIDELKTDLKSSTELYNVLNNQVVKTLKNSTENDPHWSESKQLHSKLSQVAATIDHYQRKGDQSSKLDQANSQWAAQVPYLVEVFETLDYNRLQTIKDCLLSYQTGYSDYLLTTTGNSENVMAKFLEFEPKNEIDRFAKEASTYNFILSNSRQENSIKQHEHQQQEKTRNSNSSPEKNQHRKSTLGNLGHRFTSSSTVVHHDLLNNEFSDSTNNKSLKTKKSSNKLRSRVGSIFGKKFLSNRKSQVFNSNTATPTITESPNSSTSDLRSSNNNSNTNVNTNRSRSSTANQRYSRVPQQQQQQQQQQQKASNASAQRASYVPEPVASPQFETPQRSQFVPQQQQQHTAASPYLQQQQHINSPTTLDTAPRSEITQNRNNGTLPPPNNVPVSQSPVEAQQQQQFKPLPLQPHEQQQQQQQFQPQQQYTPQKQNNGNFEHSPIHIQAPAVPPSRKQTLSGHQPPLIPSPVKKEPVVQQPQQAPPQQQQLYQQENSTPVQRNVSLLPTQITGEMTQLNPQMTVSSAALTGQSVFHHATNTTQSFGLNASVAEVMNATFKEGVLQDSHLIGEIALNYVPNPSLNGGLPVGINLKINNAAKFDKVILNQAFVEQVEQENFKVNPQFIDSRVLGAIKYSIKEPLAPIVVHPMWKFEQHQASVVLTIKIAPFVPERVRKLILEDFVVYASIDGAQATNALSKPQGSFSKEKRRITWRFKEPLVLDRDGEDTRLIARFITDGLAQESKKGISIKFILHEQEDEPITVGSGISLAGQELDVDNPFGGDWNTISTATTLAAGNYIGLA